VGLAEYSDADNMRVVFFHLAELWNGVDPLLGVAERANSGEDVHQK